MGEARDRETIVTTGLLPQLLASGGIRGPSHSVPTACVRALSLGAQQQHALLQQQSRHHAEDVVGAQAGHQRMEGDLEGGGDRGGGGVTRGDCAFTTTRMATNSATTSISLQCGYPQGNAISLEDDPDSAREIVPNSSSCGPPHPVLSLPPPLTCSVGSPLLAGSVTGSSRLSREKSTACPGREGRGTRSRLATTSQMGRLGAEEKEGGRNGGGESEGEYGAQTSS